MMALAEWCTITIAWLLCGGRKEEEEGDVIRAQE